MYEKYELAHKPSSPPLPKRLQRSRISLIICVSSRVLYRPDNFSTEVVHLPLYSYQEFSLHLSVGRLSASVQDTW